MGSTTFDTENPKGKSMKEKKENKQNMVIMFL
jgi:hypothetical protein